MVEKIKIESQDEISRLQENLKKKEQLIQERNNEKDQVVSNFEALKNEN